MFFGRNREPDNQAKAFRAARIGDAENKQPAKESSTAATATATEEVANKVDPEQERRQKIAEERSSQLQELKGIIHRKLVDKLDLTRLQEEGDNVREKVRQIVTELTEEENTLLNINERQRLVEEVLDEAFGLGPLEVLLKDPTITDILVNGPKQVYTEKRGALTLTDVHFKDNAHLLHIIDKIVSAVGRRCDEVSPMVDARLPDGSRVNAVIPPLAIDGPSVSIRRFGSDPVTIQNLVDYKSITTEMVDFMRASVRARMNILIVGGTGSGKTTLLNNLSSFIQSTHRIVTIEDAAELILQQPHIVRLESRPPNIEGKGQVTIRDLLVNSLRMRPDRIVVGEVRGGEALDMLQAMNTGHEGSMTTVHANSTRDALARVETMVAMAGYDLPVKAIRQQFASAVNVIVHGARLLGGPRRIMKISEVVGMEGDTITMQDIFAYQQEGIDEEGKAYGHFKSTGIRPTFLPRLKACGEELPVDMFTERILMKDHEE